MSNVSPSPSATTDSKPKLTKKLPTFRVGFAKQLDALRAYAVLSENGTKAVHYAKIADIIKVHEANVSSMNPFFLDIGLIEKRDAGYAPSAPVLEFNRQYGWSSEKAAQSLAPIIANTWFAEALTRRMRFRLLTEDEAIESLAAECNAGPEAKPQLRMLLDYCEAAGLIARSNGMLNTPPVEIAVHTTVESATQPPPMAEEKPFFETVPPSAPKHAPAEQSADAFNLTIKVQVSLAEMRDWPADRITAFFAGIAQVLAAKNKEG